MFVERMNGRWLHHINIVNEVNVFGIWGFSTSSLKARPSLTPLFLHLCSLTSEPASSDWRQGGEGSSHLLSTFCVPALG